MDPLTQGVVGAVAAQCAARRNDIRVATLAGFAAGMLPDVDVFIRSGTDPLLFLEYHRHFTHSLAFVPIGGMVAALLLWPFLRGREARISHHPPAADGGEKRGPGFLRLYLFTTLGYLTHGLLDACTTYGTYLLWPFSDARIAWHNIAVIDPLFSLPLLVLIAWAASKRSPALGRTALVLGLGYLLLGVVQRERADALLHRVASAEGHAIERGGAKPTLGNLLVWRGVYEYRGRLYAVALRPGLFGPDRAGAVSGADAFDSARDLPNLDQSSRLARDIARFAHFSDDWLVWVPDRHDIVGDFRYALLPGRVQPIWGIRVDPGRPDQHAPYVTLRDVSRRDWQRFTCKISGSCLPVFASPRVLEQPVRAAP
ncbi:MAG TPA: metal-dependent hydrolase [Xanthomonadaceae bacterium]|nr:metal-dependent hydrolase [Xanthomonadaceae bacterium]